MFLGQNSCLDKVWWDGIFYALVLGIPGLKANLIFWVLDLLRIEGSAFQSWVDLCFHLPQEEARNRYQKFLVAPCIPSEPGAVLLQSFFSLSVIRGRASYCSRTRQWCMTSKSIRKCRSVTVVPGQLTRLLSSPLSWRDLHRSVLFVLVPGRLLAGSWPVK